MMFTTLTTKQKFFLVAMLVVLLGMMILTAYVVYQRFAAVDEETREIFTGVPDTVTYTDENGAELSLEDYLGQVLVVTAWASWSPFTTQDFTSLNLIAEDFKGKGVAFLAINRKESKEQAQRYLSTIPEFPNLTIIIDTQDHFYTKVAGYAMPETIVFDERGEIVLHHRGAIDAAILRTAIEATLVTE